MTGTRRWILLALGAASLTASPGCGAAAHAEATASWRPATVQGAARTRAPAEASARYAQADTGGEATVATDGTNLPLLIYTADLRMAVHEVTAKQDRVEEIARELGGFLASRTDQSIVVRVPSRSFDDAMDRIQALGDVIGRQIDVQDVTEEFRDIETRIRTLEAMRRRVEQLLQQANDVQAALAVEQHLERITVQLEQLRGRLRFLADRVAFSTITVTFQERADTREPEFELPFAWLRDLGLTRLLRL